MEKQLAKLSAGVGGQGPSASVDKSREPGTGMPTVLLRIQPLLRLLEEVVTAGINPQPLTT